MAMEPKKKEEAKAGRKGGKADTKAEHMKAGRAGGRAEAAEKHVHVHVHHHHMGEKTIAAKKK